jgi:glycosyltransferase involved in cell wall biosynthesis
LILGVNGIRLMGKRSGVGRAIESILKCLGDIEHPFTEIRVYTAEAIDKEIVLPECARNVVVPSSLPKAAWEQFVLPAAHGSKHVLLCPSYVVPLPATCPTVLIHHGSYEGYPQAFSWWALNKARAIYTLSAWRATVVSTVSEMSRRDMARFYGLKPEKIHVIPEGVDTAHFRPLGDASKAAAFRQRIFGADVPFIIYVGKPTERRNLTPLIRAFARLKREKKIPHKLLLAGTALPGDSPFQTIIREEKVNDEVVALGYVNHDDMVIAYNATDLLAYPSSYEGFGMPVLEAMACGTPVLALEGTPPAEFAKGVAVLLPNAEVETLLKGIESALDGGRRQQMSLEGPKRASAYDWHLVTRQYLDLMIPLAVAHGENS